MWKERFMLAHWLAAPNVHTHMGLNMRNLSLGFANNKGADQSAHPGRLVLKRICYSLFGKYHIQNLLQIKFQFSS